MKTITEVREWRCPDCGAPAATAARDLGETFLVAQDPDAARALAMGIDLGYPRTKVQPLYYSLTLTCQNDHEHFIENQYVSQ